MKFTKDEAYKKLVSLMTENGKTINLSERSINEYLDVLIPKFATEETELDNFVSDITPLVKTADGNVRFENASFAKSYEAKKNEEIEKLKKELEVAQKSTNTNKGKNMSNDTEPSKIDLIFEEITRLKEEKEKDKALKLAEEKRATLINVLKEKGIKKKSDIEGVLSLVSISKDTDVDAVSESILTAFNKFKAPEDDQTPLGGSNGGKDIDYAEQFSALKSKIKQ